MPGGAVNYVTRRFAEALLSLALIVSISFFIMRLAPGGPFDRGRPLPAEIRVNLEAAYGLDLPLREQFLRYVTEILHGNFGASFRYQDVSVTQLIVAGAPVSMVIGGVSLVIGTAIGVTTGVFGAYFRRRWPDRIVMLISLTGVVFPVFVIAPLLIIVFCVHLRWLPVAGWSWTSPRFWVLPIMSLSLPLVATISRLMRASMLDVLGSNFVRTARAKGIGEIRVLIQHCLRPALMPVLSFLGPATAGILTGSVVVETIFGLPGIGRFFIQGVFNRDYTLVMGVVVLYAILIIICNFIVDVSYGILDPKLRS